MTTSDPTTGHGLDGVVSLLLPTGTLILMSSSAAGRDAVSTYGLTTMEDPDATLVQLAADLRATGAPEAEAAIAMSEQIVQVARDAVGWISIQLGDSDAKPSIGLVTPQGLLLARIGDGVVEWVLGGGDVLARAVEMTRDADPAAPVTITALGVGRAICGLVIEDGELRAAARTEDDLALLDEAGRDGLGHALAAVVGLVLRDAEPRP